MLKIINFLICSTSLLVLLAGSLPTLLYQSILLASCVALALYTWDKKLAIKNSHSKKQAHRISERTLLACSLVGGFYGSLLGQLMNKHKIAKPKFIVVHMMNCLLYTFTMAFLLIPNDSALRIPLDSIINVIESL
ncbi:DUF1294 domain-containing protein [Vibrio parahaemolyticus]|uniref:DUF1294 domain-containing protein n=1 Tax=Vibrio parahaemolyticus TaxID=670 RepID=A0A9Q3YHH0_VIBPH|nr:DUF1294 domain-containing protein [Vibrio parahaemolyticus]